MQQSTWSPSSADSDCESTDSSGIHLGQGEMLDVVFKGHANPVTVRKTSTSQNHSALTAPGPSSPPAALPSHLYDPSSNQIPALRSQHQTPSLQGTRPPTLEQARFITAAFAMGVYFPDGEGPSVNEKSPETKWLLVKAMALLCPEQSSLSSDSESHRNPAARRTPIDWEANARVTRWRAACSEAKYKTEFMNDYWGIVRVQLGTRSVSDKELQFLVWALTEASAISKARGCHTDGDPYGMEATNFKGQGNEINHRTRNNVDRLWCKLATFARDNKLTPEEKVPFTSFYTKGDRSQISRPNTAHGHPSLTEFAPPLPPLPRPTTSSSMRGLSTPLTGARRGHTGLSQDSERPAGRGEERQRRWRKWKLPSIFGSRKTGKNSDQVVTQLSLRQKKHYACRAAAFEEEWGEF
ncbi:hypothetical protein T439DRAFT_368731 [Meredithblackwellia eburnea MCA 4105]